MVTRTLIKKIAKIWLCVCRLEGRRRLLWILAAIAVAVCLAIGLGVGLTRSESQKPIPGEVGIRKSGLHESDHKILELIHFMERTV